MTILDKYLQHKRIQQVIPHVEENAVLLDIGCNQGELLLKLKNRVSIGIGIDPHCKSGDIYPGIRLIKGMFPGALPGGIKFDNIAALAVLEHIPAAEQQIFMANCYNALKPNGKLLLTVPDPKVDTIIKILRTLRLVKGMSFEEHFGFDVKQTAKLAVLAGFSLELHHRFQLGLNNLFVFRKMNRRFKGKLAGSTIPAIETLRPGNLNFAAN